MPKKSAKITSSLPRPKSLHRIPPDEAYLPPLKEFHKKQVGDYLSKFLFEFVRIAHRKNSVATEEEKVELTNSQSEIEYALSELEMVLDQVPNLIWRERGYEHVLNLLRHTYKIGSIGSISEVSQRYAKRNQAATARETARKKTDTRLAALTNAIKDVCVQNGLEMKAGDKFAGSIRSDVCKKLKINFNKTWPSPTTISRRIQKILES